MSYKVKASKANYNDAIADGTLVVSPATLVATVNGSTIEEKEYNGSIQTYNGTVSASSEDARFDPELFSYTGSTGVSGKDAGTHQTELDESKFQYGDSNYTIRWTVGDPLEMTIGAADLTITAKDQTYTYNGEAQGENNAVYTVDEAIEEKVEVSGLKGGDALTSITLNGQETDAGTYTGKIVASGAAVGEATANYNISYVTGDLTISPAAVTVTVINKTRTNYIGAEDPAFEATVAGTFGDDTVEYHFTREQPAEDEGDSNTPGIYTIRVYGTVAPAEDEAITATTEPEVQGNYLVSFVNGTLTIEDKTEPLYNYITFDEGENYLSLATTTILTDNSPEYYYSINGNNYHLDAESYDAEDYPLGELSYKPGTINNEKNFVTYVHKSAATLPNQPYFTTELMNVEAANRAPYRSSNALTPVTAKFTDLEGVYNFHRNYSGEIVTPLVNTEPLLTAIHVTNNGKWYGIEWKDTFNAVDSRFVPFGELLNADQYDVEEYDFNNLPTITIDNITYYYSATGQPIADNPNLPYYTVNKNEGIKKTNKSTCVGGYLTSYWPIKTQNNNYNNPDPDGYPYQAGYYHRDYEVTLYASEFAINFVNDDGTTKVIPTQYLKYGKKVTQPNQKPKKAADDNFTYEFDKWTPAVTTVTGDATYVATYKKATGKYIVHHYLNGTTIRVADDGTGWGKIGAGVTATKSNNASYQNKTLVVVGEDSQVLTISETEGANVIIFYYQLPITITAASNSWLYDGDSHTDTDVTVTEGKLLTGDVLTASAAGSVTNVADTAEGNNPIAEGYKVMNGNEDVTSHYAITALPGTLTITPRPVTFTATSETKEYTGSEIEINDLTVTETAEGKGLLANHNHNVTFSAKGTTVGEYTGDITAKEDVVITATAAEGEEAIDVTENYDITIENGTLTITQNSTLITVVPGNGSKIYDGTPLTKTEHDDFTVTGELPDGFTWTAKADGTVTNVTPGRDEKAVNAVTEFKIFNTEGEDVTDQFNNIDTTATGTLSINKATLKVTAEGKTKAYGDNDPEFTVKLEGLAKADADETIKGLLKLKFERSNVVISEAADEDQAEESTESAEGAENATGANGENVGKYAINVEGAEELDNYVVEYYPNILTIGQKEITVTAPTLTKYYRVKAADLETDAEFSENMTIEEMSFDEDPTALIHYTLTIEGGNEQGDTTGAGNYVLRASGEANQGNYHVTFVPGTLTVEKSPLYNQIDIVDDGSKGVGIYRIRKTDSGILAENTLEYYLEKSGEYRLTANSDYNPATLEEYDFTALDLVIGGYTYVYNDGTQEMGVDYYTVDLDTSAISIDAMNSIRAANGWIPNQRKNEPLDGNGFVRKYTVTLHHAIIAQPMLYFLAVDGEKGHTESDYYRLGVKTIYGPDPKKFKDRFDDYTLWTGMDQAYDFTDTVLKYDNGKVYVYSAKEKDDLVYGPYFTVDNNSSQTNGNKKVDFELRTKVHGNGNTSAWLGNVSGWLDDSQREYGALGIRGVNDNVYTSWHRNYRAYKHEAKYYDKLITVTAGSASKVYDGEPLTSDSFSVDGLPEGYTVTAVTEGSATNVGDEGKNVIKSHIIKNASGEDVTQYFRNVTYADGKLTITKRGIQVAVEDKSVEYTGSEQYGNTAYAFTNVLEGQTATIGYTAAKGTPVNTYDNGKFANDLAVKATVDGAEVDVTANYEVTEATTGKLVITDREEKYAIVVVAKSATATYDGEAHSAEGFVNESLTFEVEGNTYTVSGLLKATT